MLLSYSCKNVAIVLCLQNASDRIIPFLCLESCKSYKQDSLSSEMRNMRCLKGGHKYFTRFLLILSNLHGKFEIVTDLVSQACQWLLEIGCMICRYFCIRFHIIFLFVNDSRVKNSVFYSLFVQTVKSYQKRNVYKSWVCLGVFKKIQFIRDD